MNISDADVRLRLLTIFGECRQKPDARFDELRFLNYLTEPPTEDGQVKSSFAGNRRFVRFINNVQTEFSVCFSMKDWETNFSIDRFIDRIQYLRGRPDGSLRSLKNAMAQSSLNAVITINILLVSFLALSRNIQWLFILLGTIWLGVNAWMIWFFRRDRKYHESLLKQIEHLKISLQNTK